MPNGSGSAVESRTLLGRPAQWVSALLYRVCPPKAVQFFEHVRPSLQFLVPLFLLMWAMERWILPSSSFLLVAFVVWATLQYGNFQHKILAEELKKKWIHLLLNTSPTTPLESCQWLNKLLVQVWPNVVAPKLSKHFSAVLQKHIRIRKPKLVKRIKLEEFSLGSHTPMLGMHRTHWTTAGGQQVLHMDFEWKTNDMCIMLDTKLAMPFLGTKHILINSFHIKGDLRFLPILDGQAVLYSFETAPELSIGIAFGSGATEGDQELPTSKLPGVSAWLVKFLTDLLVKTMVEPHRRCYPLPLIYGKRTVVGGTVSITIISISNLLRANIKRQKASQSHGSAELDGSSDGSGTGGLHTFVEVELGDMSQRTDVKQGSNANWNDSFDMVLPESSSTLHVHLYEWSPNSMKLDCLTSCEIKMTHVADDSIIFWAIGSGSTAIAKHAECCGKEVQMVVPFEGTESVEVTIKLALRGWRFADGSNDSEKSTLSSEMTTGVSKQLSPTGKKFKVTIIEGRNLASMGRRGMSNTYVKLQYGKVLYHTRTLSHDVDPVWNQSFEFNEIGGGEYLKATCYISDIFGDDSVGSAKINLEGLTEDSAKDIWIPLERVSSGELRIQIEQVKDGDMEEPQNKIEGREAGVVELVLIEARNLIAADLSGTSDPYVKILYGNTQRKSKVVYKALNPQWNQKFKFFDSKSQLELHVKDHNVVLPASNLGKCIIECNSLLPNVTLDKWIPLQGADAGEIHVQITRKVHEQQVQTSSEHDFSVSSKALQMSLKVQEVAKKFHVLVDNEDLDGISMALNEIQKMGEEQEKYMLQLEREKSLLLSKISELAKEINHAALGSPTLQL